MQYENVFKGDRCSCYTCLPQTAPAAAQTDQKTAAPGTGTGAPQMDQRLLTNTCVTNMAPLMPFRVILVIKWQHNTWTNMIIKMTILRLLGSSDDKEKISVARPDKNWRDREEIQVKEIKIKGDMPNLVGITLYH